MGKIAKRAGFNQFQWKGMSRGADPSAIADEQFYLLQNARWSGGGLIERGGQSTLFASPLSPALMTGVYDSSIGGSLVGGTSGGGGGGGPVGTGGGGGGPTPPGSGDGVKLYWSADSAGPTARWVMFQDEEKANADYSFNVFETNTTTAQLQPTSAIPTSIWGVGQQWNNRLWWVCAGGAAGGWALYSQDPALGTNRPLPVQRTPFISTTVEAPKVAFTVWRGNLYFTLVLLNAGEAPVTYEYNGTTLKKFDVAGFTGNTTSPPFGYNDKLFIANGLATANSIRYVTIAGTGANATMPSTRFAVATGKSAWAEYKGTLYVCGSDGNGDAVNTQRGVIYSCTSTTFAVARDLGTGAGALVNPVHCMTVFDGYLYFIWSTAAAPSVEILGRFDGTTWTNSYYSFTSGEGPFAQIFPFKGNVVVVSTGAANVPAYRSNGTDLTSWTALQSQTAAGRERIAAPTPFY